MGSLQYLQWKRDKDFPFCLELDTNKYNKGFINDQVGSELPAPWPRTGKNCQKQSWEEMGIENKWQGASY